jgi:hypothetical protein
VRKRNKRRRGCDGEDPGAGLGLITGNVLGSTVGLVFGTFGFALTVFAIVFVAAWLR